MHLFIINSLNLYKGFLQKKISIVKNDLVEQVPIKQHYKFILNR